MKNYLDISDLHLFVDIKMYKLYAGVNINNNCIYLARKNISNCASNIQNMEIDFR